MKYNFKLIMVFIPVIMLIISIIAFVVNTRVAEGKPAIEQLSPNVVSIGDFLEIKGKNFGNNKGSSKVFVSSIDLLSRYIISWSDDSIKIVIPEKAGSGLVTIETNRGMSEPVVLVLNENVPFIGTGAYLPGLPFIETISPSSGSAGSVVRIRGDNFGYSKNNSKILFSSILSREKDTISGDTVLDNFLEIPDVNIQNWENKEILFYLPESVITGDVYVQNESGYSNAIYFEQSSSQSHIQYNNKKTYMFTQDLTLSRADNAGSLKANVWFPSPDNSNSQRNIINLPINQDISPGSCPGVNLYKTELGEDDQLLNFSQNTIIDIFEQNLQISTSDIVNQYDKNSPLYLQYTESTTLIPSTSERVKAVARSITRKKATNFDKAKAIYDYVLARLTYNSEVEIDSPELVIDTQEGDSKAYSLLFAALARSTGIPSRPINGILVDENNKSLNHWWVEFFIQGIGWFPLDPALADGMSWASEKENLVEYYWGNIDNQHIAFSRGERKIPRLFPDGFVYSNNDYSLLTQDVEIDSEIIDLRSLWSDVRITAIY